MDAVARDRSGDLILLDWKTSDVSCPLCGEPLDGDGCRSCISDLMADGVSPELAVRRWASDALDALCQNCSEPDMHCMCAELGGEAGGA